MLLAQDKDVRNYNLWQRWVLPFSISYFIADGIWYCIPKRDLLISVHHVVMIMCHYPVGEPAAALLCGAGSWKWAAWVSMTGYLAELSNPLLNVRWWLMQTLEKNHWLFGVNNVLVVLSFLARIVLFPYLIVNDIWPRRHEFVEYEQVLAFSLCIFGNVVICLLSAHWLYLLTGKGLGPLLRFEKKEGTGDLIMGRTADKKAK